MQPDPVRSPSSIPHGALMDAMCEAVDQGHPVTTNGMLAILRAAEPKLYAHWAEQLVGQIRTEGAKDASNDFDGPLLEAMFEENGGGYCEDCDPQRMADGAANWVSSLLGLEDRT